MIIKNVGRMFDFITRTWNPVAMHCSHKCVYCWATGLKEGKLKDAPRYKNLTCPVLLDDELRKRFTSADFVFVETMGDLFAKDIGDDVVLAVFKTIKDSPAEFLLLTKNPERMLKFWRLLPKNVMLGVTLESDLNYPDISEAPSQFDRMFWLTRLAECVKYDSLRRDIKLFVSIEPIMDFSGNFKTFIYTIRESLWAVAVGYDNYGHGLPEPFVEQTHNFIAELNEFIPKVYLKNMKPKKPKKKEVIEKHE